MALYALGKQKLRDLLYGNVTFCSGLEPNLQQNVIHSVYF